MFVQIHTEHDLRKWLAFMCPNYISVGIRGCEEYHLVHVTVTFWYWLFFGKQLERHLERTLIQYMPISNRYIFKVTA